MVSEPGHGSGRRLEIVLDDRTRVAEYLISRIRDLTDLPGGYMAIGVVRNHTMIGGCLYTAYRPCKDGGDIQMWCAGEKGWLSRRVIRTMFAYPFQDLNCHRITCIIAKPNKASRKLCEGIGFKLEGICKKGTNTRTDACIYGLLKSEYRWGF